MTKFRIGDRVRIIGGSEQYFDRVGTVVSYHTGASSYRFNVSVDNAEPLRFKDEELILAEHEAPAANTVHIVVHGAPATQGSKKAFIRGKKVVLVEMDEKLPAWRAAVEAAARLAVGPGWVTWDGPVAVTGTISLRRPGTTKFPTAPAGPPDLDKLQRAIGDALTKSKIITDDARIVRWDIRKAWTDDIPGANLTITQEEA